MYAVMFPDFREYFMSHGSPALQVIMCVCVCVCLCVCVCIYIIHFNIVVDAHAIPDLEVI
jgi:hypothetical protein